MKVLKESISDAILQSARKEFIRSGFKDASMRTISKNAGVGLSNMYNYFKNKDEIYRAIVKPAKEDLYAFITRQHTEETYDPYRTRAFGHGEEAVEEYITLVDKYRQELRLLLFRSDGSSQGNFREEFTDYLTRIGTGYLEIEARHHPGVKPISPFFIHAMSSWMVSVVGEIVTHDLGKPTIRDFFREYFRFEFAGWKELTGT